MRSTKTGVNLQKIVRLLYAHPDQNVEDEREEPRAQKHGYRQRQDPGQQQVSQRIHLQAGVVGGHSPRHARGKYVGRADRKTE